MNALRLTPLLPALLLAACANMTEVAPAAEKGRYQVSYNAGMRVQSWVEIKNIARDQARQFCAERGERMARPEVTSNHATGLMSKKATITFSCEPAPATQETAAPAQGN